MKHYPLLLTPVFKERVWGGSKIEKLLGCKSFGGSVGEAWILSDHPEGKSSVANGEFKGRSLSDVMAIKPEWFSGQKLDRFPLLIKLLDSEDYLSVQVHPDYEYARENENGESGKSECWYVLDCKPGSEIILSHNAKSKEEFLQLVSEQRWDDLLVRIPVKAGDFFYIPCGAVHALGKGLTLLEVQQNSDITYRIYDYDRQGLDGNKRQLHIDKAVDVISFGSAISGTEPFTVEEENIVKTVLLDCSDFVVEKWEINGLFKPKPFNRFLSLSIVDGEAKINYGGEEITVTTGSSILIPAGMGGYEIDGNIIAIVSYV